jgi:hypothetical protein
MSSSNKAAFMLKALIFKKEYFKGDSQRRSRRPLRRGGRSSQQKDDRARYGGQERFHQS